jgi:hypothetical protein
MGFHLQIREIPVSAQGDALQVQAWQNAIWNHIDQFKIWDGNRDPDFGPIFGPVSVRIKWYVNNLKTKKPCTDISFGDLDNMAKSILDALKDNGLADDKKRRLIEDDSMVVELALSKHDLSIIRPDRKGHPLQLQADLCIEEGRDLVEIIVTQVWLG